MTPRDDETQYIPRNQGYPQSSSRGEYRDEDFGSRPRQHFPTPEEQYRQDYQHTQYAPQQDYQQQYWQQDEQRYAPAPPESGDTRSGRSGVSVGALIGWVVASLALSGVVFYILGRSTAPEPTPERITETQVSTVTATTTVTTEPEEGLLPSVTLPDLPDKAPDGGDIQRWLDNLLGGGAEADQNAPEPAN